MYTIYRAQVHDVEKVKQLFEYFVSDDTQVTKPFDTSYIQSLLKREDFIVLIAEYQHVVAGGLTGYMLPDYLHQSKEFFLYEIGVKEEYQRQGIASQLIVSVKPIVKDLGAKAMYVLCEVDNDQAQGLYRKTFGKNSQRTVEYFETSNLLDSDFSN